MRAFMAGLALATASLTAVPARAEVAASTAAGFVVEGRLEVSGASPEDLWATFVHPEAWWNGSHSWSGNAANLSLEPVAGGCFCESIPGARHGSVEHMRVVQVRPGNSIVLRGSLGPLQAQAVTGILTVTMEQTPGTSFTWLDWRYAVGGYSEIPFTDLASAVDGVIAEQMTRLVTAFTTRYDQQASQYELPDD